MSIGIGVGDILKICEIAGRVYKNCASSPSSWNLCGANYAQGRDCTGEYKSLTTEARSLTNLLEDINDKFPKIPDTKRKQLEDAYEPCIEVLQELDKLLNHYNSLDTKSKRAWDRLKWDPNTSKTLRDRLTSSVTMLNGFYSSLMIDNQVLILEALERLEHDYKGGHREESIASLERITSGTVEEDEEDEAAWTQILRDLEDVGVAKQDALGYRDMIVDWLVQAVNEGRLLEQHAGPDSFLAMSDEFKAALPVFQSTDEPGSHHLDVPAISRSQSTPQVHSSPLMAPPSPDHQSAHSVPSAASLPVPELSGRSSYAASYSSDTDTSSLYARPEPPPRPAPANGLFANQIRRIPVPPRGADAPEVVPQPFPAVTNTSPSPAAFAIPPPPVRAPPSLPQVNFMPPAPALPQVPRAPPAPVHYPVPSVSVTLPPPQPYVVPQLSPSQMAPQVVQTQVPPSYYDKDSSITVDIAWTAQQVIAAWNRKDFSAAAKHLEEQLTAVERGHSALSTGTQPDRRILRHLIGVCYSFTGEFVKAKGYFESVFNGTHINHTALDDGDIAAARWLGDVCLHLREHHNAALAWGVAFEGSTGRYGPMRDRTVRVGAELRALDHWLYVFRRIENTFHSNRDPTSILQHTPAIEKSNLMTSLEPRLVARPGFAPPSFRLGPRPKLDMSISEGFLLGPLISLSAWPLPWDATFSPIDAAQLDRHMNTVKTTNTIPIPLVDRNLPTLSLGDSKKLHYVTKKGSRWLIETVKKGLQEMCIEHSENPSQDSIMCTLNQHRDGFAFSEGVEIQFKKLQFRSIYGLRVSDVRWRTRILGPVQSEDTSDFRDILKSILESAENEPASGHGFYGASMLMSTSVHEAPGRNYEYSN
jgi:hypothetical protein